MNALQIYWRGAFPSSTGRVSKKTGQPIEYTVTLFNEGSASCSCYDYVIRGINDGDPGRRCKHIREAIRQHPEWQTGRTGAPATATVAPIVDEARPRSRPKVELLTEAEMERGSRRRR